MAAECQAVLGSEFNMLRLEDVIKRLKEEYPDTITSLPANATMTDVAVRKAQVEMISFITLIGETKKKGK